MCRSSLETPIPILRVILAEKGAHFRIFFSKDRPIFHNCRDKNGPGKILGIFFKKMGPGDI